MIKESIVCGILKNALYGSGMSPQADADIEEYMSFAKLQQIEALLIAGAGSCFGAIPVRVKRAYYGHVLAGEMQLAESQRLFELFRQNGIDHLPLKGCIMKPLYPAGELRSMGDIDVLIRTEQYDKIRPLMCEAGWTEDLESDHELIWYKNGMELELHKRLIPSYNKDYYEYYGDGWQLAKRVGDSSTYEMSSEDTFIYLFTHYAKHYRDSGAGIRQALDLRVYTDKHPEMDRKYLSRQFKRLQLDRFYENTMYMLRVWFDGEVHTEASRIISDRLFDNGVFGTKEDSDRSEALKKSYESGSVEKAQRKDIKRLLFPAAEDIWDFYPILKKSKLLLPLVWVARGLRVLLFDRGRFSEIREKQSHTQKKDIDQYQEMLHKSGLDFNFK